MSALRLSDAKDHLNIKGSQHDGELLALIDAAEAAIAERVGPLEVTTVTAQVRGGGSSLVLPVAPVVQLTSVTGQDGSTVTVAGLRVGFDAGVVTADAGFPATSYDVVYQAGRAELPDDLLLAVKELVRHLWSTQRGPTRRPGAPASEETANTVPGAAYLFPFRVEQLLSPHAQPGFA